MEELRKKEEKLQKDIELLRLLKTAPIKIPGQK